MEKHKDYIRDISEIRSMMERSTKFLSLSGWAGIMAGLYALAGAYIAYRFFYFNPHEIIYTSLVEKEYAGQVINLFFLALAILALSVVTAIYFSGRRAQKRNERLWNPTSKRLLLNMLVPLGTGGIFVLILLNNGLIALVAPATLIFYGLSLFVAGRFTYNTIKILGIVQIVLGLASSLLIGYGLLFWALGFGVAHIVYGIYMQIKYER